MNKLKKFRTINLFIFCIILSGCKTEKNYLKLYYTQMADDGKLEPCLCLDHSKWGMYSISPDSIITYDNKKIDRFLKAFNLKNVDTVASDPEFSAAFVYKKGKVIDTIYSNPQLSVFAPERIKLDFPYPIFEALSIKSNTADFIPEEFIEKYEKSTGYTVQKSSEEFQKFKAQQLELQKEANLNKIEADKKNKK